MRTDFSFVAAEMTSPMWSVLVDNFSGYAFADSSGLLVRKLSRKESSLLGKCTSGVKPDIAVRVSILS